MEVKKNKAGKAQESLREVKGYKVIYGDFKNQKEALKEAAEVKKKGFPHP